MKKLILLSVFCFLVGFAKAQTADELFDKGEYIKALTAYEKVIKVDSTNVKALNRLGFIWMQTGTGTWWPINYFEKALRYEPNNVVSNYYLGLTYKGSIQKYNEKDRNMVITLAKKYLTIASSLGSDEAKQELKGL
ncbi:tetratricopeptide repeat protein [Pedobacter sp. MW01-1-1]|uniref:tetratricopeptide repeat protein n=1 Tax=Pedobacter sp. MW01-1-1 TaxID=3383027 RepID=UPI003FEF84FB